MEKEYIIIGPRCWGRASTMKKAKQLMLEGADYQKEAAKKNYVVYLCDKTADATVGDLGSLQWSKDKGNVVLIYKMIDGKEVPL